MCDIELYYRNLDEAKSCGTFWYSSSFPARELCLRICHNILLRAHHSAGKLKEFQTNIWIRKLGECERASERGWPPQIDNIDTLFQFIVQWNYKTLMCALSLVFIDPSDAATDRKMRWSGKCNFIYLSFSRESCWKFSKNVEPTCGRCIEISFFSARLRFQRSMEGNVFSLQIDKPRALLFLWAIIFTSHQNLLFGQVKHIQGLEKSILKACAKPNE